MSLIEFLLYVFLVLFYHLSRSKLHTYDDVVERVAHHLGLDDSSKIRLTSHNCYSQQPKPQPIKYRGVEHLSDMLTHYNQVLLAKLYFCLILTIVHFLINTFFFVEFLLINSNNPDIFFVVDFWYFILWSIGYTFARTPRPQNIESCVSSCNQRWSECRLQIKMFKLVYC